MLTSSIMLWVSGIAYPVKFWSSSPPSAFSHAVGGIGGIGGLASGVMLQITEKNVSIVADTDICGSGLHHSADQTDVAMHPSGTRWHADGDYLTSPVSASLISTRCC